MTLTYVGGGVSNYIVLGTNFWGQTSQNQDVTLVHEASRFKRTTDLARKFANYEGSDRSEASAAFTDWLKGGCK